MKLVHFEGKSDPDSLRAACFLGVGGDRWRGQDATRSQPCRAEPEPKLAGTLERWGASARSARSSSTPLAQLHGRGGNVVVLWLERASRNDVGPNAQELLQILKQAGVIKKSRTRFEIDEQVQVAVVASLSPGD